MLKESSTNKFNSKMMRKLVSFACLVGVVPLHIHVQMEPTIDNVEMLAVVPHAHNSREENEADNGSDADTVCSQDDVVLRTRRTNFQDRLAIVGIFTLCCGVIVLCTLLFSCKIPPYNSFNCDDQECLDTNYCEICGCRNKTDL